MNLSVPSAPRYAGHSRPVLNAASPLSVLKLGIAVLCLLLAAGCATLPDASTVQEAPGSGPVSFDNADGTVSAGKSAAIIQHLKTRSGDTDILETHLAIEQAINADSTLVLGNRLILLEDGPATFEAIIAALTAAKDHINVETYIFADDEIGRKFADLLLKKQAEGVQVNLVYDSVGCLFTPVAFFDRLEAAGIRVVEFNPVNPLGENSKTWLVNNRDHRKLMVVDGHTAFLGGINISEVYSSSPFTRSVKKSGKTSTGWRDTHLQLEGPVVAEFQKLFMNTWARQTGEHLGDKDYFPILEREGDEIVRAIGSASDEPHSLIYLTLLSAIASASQTIHITNAYFVPDPQLLTALTDAARRGVEVALVLPSHTDSWATFHAGRSHYSELLKAGVKIYERRDAIMHSKTAIIDGVWSTIGSTNLDWRSFLHNDELNAVILGRNFAREMEVMFAKDLSQSNAIDLRRWQQRSPLLRIKERVARLGEYWL